MSSINKILVVGSLALALSLGATAGAQTANHIDLFWEADTYTPPFYRGHSQVSAESEVEVVADAYIYDRTGKKLPDNQLNF